ncbi:MAG: 4Fe-4S binding protein [Bacteroidales bacterium]|nr:4Fe-4S binding protein [Bacteroidales bacterium]
MKLLFEQINNDFFMQTDFEHINLFQTTFNKEVFDMINRFCGSYKGSFVHREISEDSGWPSWYPIIDYSRCTGCGQCADFCIFGVYEKNENSVKVVNPKGCKNNCPACARICPSVAIIFPKYTQGGAIGGSDEIDEQIEQQRHAKDIKSLLGDDLYTALEKRKAQRQSIIREEAMKKAIDEKNIAIQKDTKSKINNVGSE